MPFLHFFDGFRTSTRSAKVEELTVEDMRAMIDDELVAGPPPAAAMSPDRPVIRGTSQNPDVYFQGRETVNTFYARLPRHRAEGHGQVRQAHRPAVPPVRLRRAPRTPTASSSMMGSGRRGRARDRRVPHCQQGEKVGVLKVRLYRPFSIEHFVARPAQDGQDRRRPGPHQGAGLRRRAAVPGRAHRPGRDRPDGRPGRRRPLRPVQQGIHPGDGQGRLRRAGQASSPRTTSPSASTTT